MLIRFSATDEFVEELRKDAALVERGIVRVTFLWVPSKMLPVKHITLVATAKVGTNVVRLERYVGDSLTLEHNGDAGKQLDMLLGELKATLGSRGFDVRAGELTTAEVRA